MTISQLFSSFFHPTPTVKCQPSHQQRHQNQQFSQEIQALNLQAIRKQHGKLDQRFEKVIEDANLQSAYRVQKYMKHIRGELQKVDNYCNKTQKYGSKQECVEQLDGMILGKFQKPFIKSQLNLYKVANLCLIRGETIGACVQQVKKENLNSLGGGLKSLKELVNQKCF